MTDQPRGSGPDPIGDFQRWVLRSSARGVSRELGDQIKTAFGRGGGGGNAGDVWETATAEPVSGEAPECAWCPVCRAARLLRVSGPGLASQMAAAGDAFGNLLQDAMSVAEAALASATRTAGPGPAADGAASVTVVEVSVDDRDPEPEKERGVRGRDGAEAPQYLEGLPREPDDRD